MAAYYGVFKQPTQEDFRRYQLMQGNADPSPISYEEWLTRPGQGERVGGRLSKSQARDLARQNPGSTVLGLSGGSNPFDQFGDMIGGLVDEPGIQALLGAGAVGALGPSLFGSAGAGGTGLAEAGVSAAGGELTAAELAAAGITDAELMAAAGITPTFETGGLMTVGGTEAATAGATPWLSNAPAGSVFGAGAAAPFASSLGGAMPAVAGAGLGAGLGAGFGSGLGNVLGDLWGGIKGSLPSADTALAMAPILAAINYAKNTDPFDTSRLRSIYNEFDPSSLAYEYDQNTGAGRSALTSSLQNRGVMGSSFATNDLTNFQTSRDLGRRSLVNQGLAAKGDIANSILNASVKEREMKNQLYGTSLLALGNVFGGRNQYPVYK